VKLFPIFILKLKKVIFSLTNQFTQISTEMMKPLEQETNSLVGLNSEDKEIRKDLKTGQK
jgi:hypothetical protein